MMRKIALMLTSLLFVIAVSGCNTMKGVGQDIEAGGKAISSAASK